MVGRMTIGHDTILPTCLHSALWLPQASKQNQSLSLQDSATVRAPAEAPLLPVGTPAEQLEEAVVLEVVGMHLNANGVLPAACLLWPVLHAEQPGRRCEAIITCHPMIPIP